MTLKTNARLITTLAACIAISIVMVVVARGFTFVVVPPAVELSAAPKTIGEWKAEEAELTDAEFGVLNAADLTSLLFRNRRGQRAFVHVATWTDPAEVAETCPHHPGVCYAGNGWFAMETRQVELEVDGSGPIPIEISSMDRNGQRLVIAFTYSMGTEHFSTDSAARIAQARMWGQQQWPAVTKFLIQIDANSIDEARPVVDELLGEFLRWYNSAQHQGHGQDAAA